MATGTGNIHCTWQRNGKKMSSRLQGKTTCFEQESARINCIFFWQGGIVVITYTLTYWHNGMQPLLYDRAPLQNVPVLVLALVLALNNEWSCRHDPWWWFLLNTCLYYALVTARWWVFTIKKNINRTLTDFPLYRLFFIPEIGLRSFCM